MQKHKDKYQTGTDGDVAKSVFVNNTNFATSPSVLYTKSVIVHRDCASTWMGQHEDLDL